jgi:hypothetical protein
MTTVAIISEQLAAEIQGNEYADGQLYFPVQLHDGRWFVGVAEAEALGINEFVEVELELPPLTELTDENE